jgi:hypothetical protein
MKLNIDSTGTITIDGKIITEEDLTKRGEIYRQAIETAKLIKKKALEIEQLRKDYNTFGKEING